MTEVSWLFPLLATLLGLIVGSFLNVVIHRLPQMQERLWIRQCRELEGVTLEQEPRYDLVMPGSHCPSCHAAIKPWHNIPVLSWIWLRGRCAECAAWISPRYPIVEALTAILSLVVALHFGYSAEAWAVLVLTWFLIAMSVIDYDHQLLPDVMTLPLLWLGLLASVFWLPLHPADSIIGAILGYGVLWAVYHGYRLVTGKEGMGYGDFKLLAALGAWVGWQMLPLIILGSSLVGAVLGILFITARGGDRHVPIPFGPFLAIAGWVVILWGEGLTRFYLGLFAG